MIAPIFFAMDAGVHKLPDVVDVLLEKGGKLELGLLCPPPLQRPAGQLRARISPLCAQL